MRRHYARSAASAWMILIAMAACVVPGQAVQPAPVPSIDANAIATAVEGTAQAAAQQADPAQPSPAATAMTGTVIENAADGTTAYIDYDGGFAVSFPAGWLALKPNSEEFNNVLAKEGAANQMLGDQMKFDLTQTDANFDPLYVYILRPDLKKNFLFGLTDVIWISEDTRPLDSVTLGELVRNAEATSKFAGFHADTAQVHNGEITTIEIGGPYKKGNAQGEIISYYKTYIYFKPSSNSLVLLTFLIPQDYRTQLSSDVNFVIASIRIVE